MAKCASPKSTYYYEVVLAPSPDALPLVRRRNLQTAEEQASMMEFQWINLAMVSRRSIKPYKLKEYLKGTAIIS